MLSGTFTQIDLYSEGGAYVSDASVYDRVIAVSYSFGGDDDPALSGWIDLFSIDLEGAATFEDTISIQRTDAVALPYTDEAYQTGGLRLFAGGVDDVSGAEIFTVDLLE